MKITYSNSKIKSFGGINFADLIVSKSNAYQTIDQTLGNRGIRPEYNFSDLFRSYFLLTLCGGECAEDITEHLRGELDQVKDFEVCSADTLLRMQKEISTEKEMFISDTGIKHEFNINMTMNNLMVKLLMQTGQLSPDNNGYIFDYDNQFIPTDTKLRSNM